MTFTINELSGYALETAIREVMSGLELESDPSMHIQEWRYYQRVVENLDLSFDENGHLV